MASLNDLTLLVNGITKVENQRATWGKNGTNFCESNQYPVSNIPWTKFVFLLISFCSFCEPLFLIPSFLLFLSSTVLSTFPPSAMIPLISAFSSGQTFLTHHPSCKNYETKTHRRADPREGEVPIHLRRVGLDILRTDGLLGPVLLLLPSVSTCALFSCTVSLTTSRSYTSQACSLSCLSDDANISPLSRKKKERKIKDMSITWIKKHHLGSDPHGRFSLLTLVCTSLTNLSRRRDKQQLRLFDMTVSWVG